MFPGGGLLCDREDLIEWSGKRGLKGLDLSCYGMREREVAGMERKSAEGVGPGAVFLISHGDVIRQEQIK